MTNPLDMEFRFDIEGTCSEEEPYLICLQLTTAGAQSTTTYRLTLFEASELYKMLAEAIDEIAPLISYAAKEEKDREQSERSA